jgi:hypothetical protein
MTNKTEELWPSSGNDLEGPRLLPQDGERASSLAGCGWISLADTTMNRHGTFDRWGRYGSDAPLLIQ